MRTLTCITVLTVVAATSPLASASDILGFEAATAGTTLTNNNLLFEDGYRIEYWAGDFPLFVDTGGNIAVGDSVPASTPSLAAGLQISRGDGLPFTLLALDVANIGTGFGFPAANMSISADGGPATGFSPVAGAGFTTEIINDPAFTNISVLNVSLFHSDDFTGQPNGGAPANFVADNFQVQVIPEPATLALLGLGGVALLRRRRHG